MAAVTDHCDVCERDDAVTLTDRGPVKSPLAVTRIGNFRFCDDCLAASTEDEVIVSDVRLHRRTLAAPRGTRRVGESWITSAETV